MDKRTDKELESTYLDYMADKYDIKLSYNANFVEATTPYMEGVVEYAVTAYDALLCICVTIEVTSEYNHQKRRYND